MIESTSTQLSDNNFQDRLLQTIMQASPDPIYVLDTNSRFIQANAAAQDLHGLTEREFLGKTSFELDFPFATELQQGVEKVVASREATGGELTYVLTGGQGERFEYLLTPVLDRENQVEAVVGIAQDVTERKNAEEKAWHNANYDRLTALPNRRLFRDRLKQEVKSSVRTGQPLALLMINIDRFKSMDHSFGQQAGDQLLCEAASRISSCIRETDTAARLGKEEFTVILTSLQNVSRENLNVDAIAKKIDEALAEPFFVASREVHIAASIGISLCPQDGDSPESLLRSADEAMSKTKVAGNSRICFFS